MYRTHGLNHSPIHLLKLAALTLLAGCAGLLGGGPHRSPQFASGNAPEPTVATTVLSCVSSALPPGSGDDLSARFGAIERSKIPSALLPLPRASESIMCSTFAASDNFHAWRDWSTPPSLASTIRDLAQSQGAKSIAIPALRVYARCEQNTKTVRDASGATVATIQDNTQTCRPDRMKDVGLFLFAADGSLMYRSTKRVGMGSSEDPEDDMVEVLTNIPATFAAAGVGVAPAPAMAPTGVAPAAPAAPQGVGPTDPKVDDAMGELDSKAPAECKKFIKAICRSPQIPDTGRLQMCAGYVTTVNQVVQKQKAKAGETCKSLKKSAAPDE